MAKDKEILAAEARMRNLLEAPKGGGPVSPCYLYTADSYDSYIYGDPTNSSSSTLLQPTGYTDKTAALAANGIITPVSWPVGSSCTGTTARYQNKGFDRYAGPDLSGFIKWTIDELSHTMVLDTIYHWGGGGGTVYEIGSGLCAKDANTLIGCEWEVTENILHSNGTWSQNFLFKLPGIGYNNTTAYNCKGDIIYRPSDDSLVLTAFTIDPVSGNYTHKVFHYQMDGTMIDQLDVTQPLPPYAIQAQIITLFCVGGEIFGHDGGSRLWKIGTNPLSISLHQHPFYLGQESGGDGGTSPECCDAPPDPDPDPDLCYQIGDITDPADNLGGFGGMIFATPNSPGNPTQYYWEVGLQDLCTGGTPWHNFGVSGLNARTLQEYACGVPTIPGGGMVTIFSNTIRQIVGHDPLIPNNQFIWGYGPGSPNPTSSVSLLNNFAIGDVIDGLDAAGLDAFPPSPTPIITDIVTIPAMAASVPSGPNIGQVVTPYPWGRALFTFNVPATTYPPLSQPVVQLSIYTNSTPPAPWTEVGCEWGAYGSTLPLPTSGLFDTGFDNTTTITNLPAQTVWPTHKVAAHECRTYWVNSALEKWHLPSLGEFDLIYNNVGPLTPFGATLNLSDGSMSESVYWTSTEKYLPGGTLPNLYYAWAYQTSVSWNVQPNPVPIGPNIAKRCHSLSVRPIRKFECIPYEYPDEDSYNWVDGQAKQPNFGLQGQYPFIGIPVPGLAGTGYSRVEVFKNIPTPPSTTPYGPIVEHTFEGVIGGTTFELSLSSTDAAGNEYDVLTDFDDANNPDGYYWKIWAAETVNGTPTNTDKTYLGTWHYQNCTSANTQNNRLKNVATYHNYPWYNIKDFPDRMSLKFSNVTHIDGPHEIVNYGRNGVGNYQNASDGAPVGFSSSGTPNEYWNTNIVNPSVNYQGYNNEYLHGAYLTRTAGFAYIQLHSNASVTKTIALPDVHTGQNTVYQRKQVVCFKDVMEEIKIGQQTTPYTNSLHPDVGGSIGIGDYGITAGLPPNPVYGGGYIPPTAVTLNDSPGDPYPKHYLFPWMADYTPPSTSELPIFQDFLTGLNAMTCNTVEPCGAWEVGDVGPAGGIIVAVPLMNVNDQTNNVIGPVVPPLQGTEYVENPTNYYFELSPNNLNLTSCQSGQFDIAVWGNAFQSVSTNPTYSDYWQPDVNNAYYSGFLPIPNIEMVGEGHQATLDIMMINMGLPLNPIISYIDCWQTSMITNPRSAFEMCNSYTLNGYIDWFLPTVNEMEFARNYSPPGTLYDSGDGNYFFHGHYWTCNMPGDGVNEINAAYRHNPFGVSNPSYYAGLAVSMSPMNNTSSPDGRGWKTIYGATSPLNVRAMRRFLCWGVPPVDVVIDYAPSWQNCARDYWLPDGTNFTFNSTIPGWHDWWAPWGQAASTSSLAGQVGPISFPSITGAPFPDTGVAFLDWLESQIGPVSVGDHIFLRWTTPWFYTSINFGPFMGCHTMYVTYHGVQAYQNPFVMLNPNAFQPNLWQQGFYPNCGGGSTVTGGGSGKMVNPDIDIDSDSSITTIVNDAGDTIRYKLGTIGGIEDVKVERIDEIPQEKTQDKTQEELIKRKEDDKRTY